MKCVAQDQSYTLEFSLEEMLYVCTVLQEMSHHYGADLGTLPPAVQAFWQGTFVTQPRQDTVSEEDQELLRSSREELRSDRLTLAAVWREELLTQERLPWTLKLTSDDRDEFVSILNDRRLILAFEHDLLAEDYNDEEFYLKLPQDKREALYHISRLATIIGITLVY